MAKRYGAGVVHKDSKAVNETVNMTVNPSLVQYDTLERALSGLNENGEAFKLMSPKMMFVRGFINVNFSNDDVINFTTIEQSLRTQAGTNEILHGIYLVKFSSTSGINSALCEVETNLNILASPTYFINDGHIFLLIYEYDVIKKLTHITDKTGYFFQEVNGIINSIIASIKGKKDTVTKYKGINEHGLNPSRIYDNDNETGIEFAEGNKITFRSTQISEDVLTDFYNNLDFFGVVTNAEGVAFTAAEGGFKVIPSDLPTETDLTIFEPTRKTAPDTFVKKNLLLNVLDKIVFGFEAGRNIIFTNLKAWFSVDVELKKKLIDVAGSPGDYGMHLISNGANVYWRYNKIRQEYTHVHPDDYVTTGYSPFMVANVYKKLVAVHLHLNSTISDTGATLKVRIFGLESNGTEQTIRECEVFNGRSYQTFFITTNSNYVFTVLRSEVIQTPTNVRGLNVVFEFIDWS